MRCAISQFNGKQKTKATSNECLFFCSNCRPISTQTNPVLFFSATHIITHTRTAAFYCRSYCDRIYNFNSFPNTHAQAHCVWLAIIFDVFVFSSFCRIRFVCLIFSVGRTETRLSFKAAIQHVFILPLSVCDGFVFSFYLFIYFFLQDLIPFHCYLHHKIPTSGCVYV